MADLIPGLMKDPRGTLSKIKTTNLPILQDIWNAVPANYRAGLSCPERGSEIKQWLVNWAEQLSKGGKDYDAEEHENLPPTPLTPSRPKSAKKAAAPTPHPPTTTPQANHSSSTPPHTPQPLPTSDSLLHLQQLSSPGAGINTLNPAMLALLQSLQPNPQQQAPQQNGYLDQNNFLQGGMGNPQMQHLRQQQQSLQMQQQQLQQLEVQLQQQQQQVMLQQQAGQLGQLQMLAQHSHDISGCAECKKKDIRIEKLKKLLSELLEQLDDTVLEARGDLTFALA
mmetsp:Transcript_20702/g.40992  ORF Transcript_20702/g.40992 Transcript_20702/m.40992 type:complete len:281 (-) Transcript_20702:209-1051(-)